MVTRNVKYFWRHQWSPLLRDSHKKSPISVVALVVLKKLRVKNSWSIFDTIECIIKNDICKMGFYRTKRKVIRTGIS